MTEYDLAERLMRIEGREGSNHLYTAEVTYDGATMVGKNQPLQYRGYVYDEETGLYYLQSRYYNPEWGRFISADSVINGNELYEKILFFGLC